MEVDSSSLQNSGRSSTIISANQYALIVLPSDGLKIIELREKGSINLGKFGTFNISGILGYPFGQSFEILDEKQVRPISSLDCELEEKIIDDEQDFTEDDIKKFFQNSAESNQNIIDVGAKIQKLTADDIDKLKKSGASSDIGRSIIKKIVEGHEGFDKKTIYSQQKYLKKKQQKFLRRFTVEYLGSSQLLQYYIEKDIYRVLDMSEESLGMLLAYANVRPGGRYLLVDDTGGIILYALMERMKGEGTIITISENEHPNHIALDYSGYSKDHINKMVKNINWLQITEPDNEKIAWKELTEEEIREMKHSKQIQYHRRTKRAMEINDVIDDFTLGNFDAFIAVSSLNFPSLLPFVLDKVGGSRPVVLYNQFKESLLETQHFLSEDRRVLAPTIFETRVRHFQTIPGRIHPTMTMAGYGGYILWGTRVYPKASGITAVGRGIQKKKQGQVSDDATGANDTNNANNSNNENIEGQPAQTQ